MGGVPYIHEGVVITTLISAELSNVREESPRSHQPGETALESKRGQNEKGRGKKEKEKREGQNSSAPM